MWIELAAGCDQILCNILVNVHLFSIHWWNSPGVMLLIFKRASGHVPLKILSIEDGTVLRNFNHLLHRNQKVDFIEQFNEKLLVKQENENLQILDVRSPFLPVKTRQFFSCHFLFIETICFHIIWAQKKSEQPSFYNSLSLSLQIFDWRSFDPWKEVKNSSSPTPGHHLIVNRNNSYKKFAGPELPVDASQQNGVHNPISIHLPVREPAVLDLPQSDRSRLELSRRARHHLRRPPALAPRLQHEQHLHHDRPGSYNLLL